MFDGPSVLPLRALADEEPLLPGVGAGVTVPLLDGDRVPYADLDQAASSAPLVAVEARLREVVPYYASVHRGAGFLSMASTQLYERSRRTVAAHLGARTDDVLVFTRNTTDALNLLSCCVPGPGRVLHLDIEHHANLLPWRRHGSVTMPAGADVETTLEVLETELRRLRPELVAVTGASNVTGEVLPLDRLVPLVHRYGSRIVVDAAQLAPHRSFSLDATGVDYVALSGHKLGAPYGAGVLVGRRDWLDAAEPYLRGGGAVRSVTLDGVDWASAPQRHEAGTPNLLGVAALAAACEAFAALPPRALQRHDDRLRRRLEVGLSTVPGLRLIRLWPDASDRVGVVTFEVVGQDAGLIAARLSAEYGVGVRDGRFCAHPLTARLGVGHGALRASVGATSAGWEVDRVVDALGAIVRNPSDHAYHVVDGRWSPVHDTRPLPAWASLEEPVGAAACRN